MIKPHIHKTNIIRAKNVDKVITDIINKMYKEGPISNVDLEKLAYIKLFHPEIFKLYESKILYLMGIFYKPLEPHSLVEMVYNAYAKDIKTNLKNSFTPIQVNMIKNIDEKKYFSFSAPTSSGKSYLFMDLIKHRKDDIVIIVPSRALIAEYLEKTLKILDNNKDVLVLQFVDNINIRHTKRRVFILTPERARELFKFKDLFNIGLFLIDEAQLSEENMRGLTFDSLIRRINTEFPNATKVFAHPFINNPQAKIITCQINDVFVKSGGCGLTLGLLLAGIFTVKSQQLKSLLRMAFVPGLFNINEPLIFGLPIVFNPYLLVPFVLVPLIAMFVTYFSIVLGFMAPFSAVQVPWTTPPIIAGFLLNGWQGAVVQIINLAIATVIYFPFLRAQDKAFLKEEQEQMEMENEGNDEKK